MAEHGLTSHIPPLFARSLAAEKGITLGLLLVLLLSAVTGMTTALKGPDPAALWLGLLFGMLLGWLLALARQPLLRAVAIVLGLGLLYLLLIPGGLSGKIVALAAESLHHLLGLIPFYQRRPVDPGQVMHRLQDLSTSTQILMKRVRVWTAALLSDQPVFDPVAAGLVWNALVWMVAAWAGWIIEARRNALLAVFPALILSLGTLSSGRRMSDSLYLMLGVTLLLLATSKQDARRWGWEAGRVAYPARKGRQILGAALLGTLVLVLFSVLLPSLSVQRIRQWIDEQRRPATREQSRLAQSLGILPGGTPLPDAFRTVRSPGLPRDYLIGSGPELSQRVVMTIRVGGLAPNTLNGQPLPLYWRGFTYDVYTGQGWSSSATTEQDLPANQPLQSEQARGFVPIQQDVSPVEDLGGTIYAAGEPFRLDFASQAAWRGPGDLFGIRTEGTEPYEVVSSIPVLDEQTLRSAGERYPDWVRQHFLSLPDEVPERVKALAIRLTASLPTPYDRAKAIESYLRTFPYTLDVARPPLDRDVVDYFLFDLKKGYCDYYASAMVVLSRAAGIPARLAIGYATGTYNLNSKRFVVTDADAHSWVEIYFPGFGWVPFEPTAALPTLERSEGLVPETPQISIPPAAAANNREVDILPWAGRLLAGILGLAGIIAAAWAVSDEFKLHHLPRQSAAAVLYRRLRRAGRRLGIVSKPGDTPYEFTAALRSRLLDLTAGSSRMSFGANVTEGVSLLMDGIVRGTYHPSPPKEAPLLNQWSKLRWQLGLLSLLKTWQALSASLKGTAGDISRQTGSRENRSEEVPKWH